MIRTLRLSGILLAMLVAAAGAQATMTTFTGLRTTGIGTPSGSPLSAHDAFIGNITNVGVENFTGFNVGDPAGVTLAISFTGNGNTATISGDDGFGIPNFEVNDYHGNVDGRYDTTGAGDRYLQSLGTPIIITFGAAVNAFGFYGTDIGDFGTAGGAALSVDLTDSNGNVTNKTIQSAGVADGSLLFWGFVDTGVSYTSIRFNGSALDGIGLDDLIVGNLRTTQPPALPEPGSMALGGVALLSMLAMRRRKH